MSKTYRKQNKYKQKRRGKEPYQLVGSIFVIVKKQAFVGSPMSSIVVISFAKKFGGASSGIGLVSADK